MRKRIDIPLLQRYIENKCTAAEVELVEQWLIDPANEKYAREFMQQHWQHMQQQVDLTPELSHILKNIHNRIEAGQTLNAEGKASTLQIASRRWWMKVAAGFLVLLSASLLLYYFANDALVPDTHAWTQTTRASHVQEEIKRLVLPDGTQVWLNAKSSLRYPSAFLPEKREVYLDGEAYFDVTEDATRPFIVYTSDIKVKVLGTAFTVKAYSNDERSEATLVRGKVLVESSGFFNSEVVELEPNQRVVYSRTSNELKRVEVVADDFVRWREGTLRFEDESFENVINIMERWYDVEIVVDGDQKMNCTLTASIDKEPLEEMLELIKTTTGATYSISGNKVFIEGKLCD